MLALLQGEPGSEIVSDCLSDAVMSAGNGAELVTKLVEAGQAPARTAANLQTLQIEVSPL